VKRRRARTTVPAERRARLIVLIITACAVIAAVTAGITRDATHRSSAAASARSTATRPSTVTGTDSNQRLRSRLPPATNPRRPDLRRLVGQLLIGSFPGSNPPAELLDRIRAGHLGGVILFGDNTAGDIRATHALVLQLQAAAHAGGNPPLLIMTDQEGGEVTRIQGAPALAPRDMTSNAIAHAQGASAGQLLRAAGVNVDLAPVADVESTPASFLGSRAFGSSAAVVAARACAFAGGLAAAGVAYTLKHFPGLGRALTSTDTGPVTVAASPAALRADYLAYRRCGAAPTALVMVSSAIYPNLTGTLPAVMSPTIYHRELPLALGRTGSRTISDDLGTRALAGQPTAALQAIKAGLDLALYANSESASADVYAMLLAAARRHLIPLPRLEEAVRRIEALKRALVR
jgi:beta-N-acetylhexosaminidase